ncbi:MAG: 30S ribosomal protein S18 [Patescibacteria group bacterium]
MNQCYFCVNNIKEIDYKDSVLLSRFIDSYARIVGRRRQPVCAHHQRQLSRAIKRARFLALLPFIAR